MMRWNARPGVVKLLRLMALLSTGILANHQSCSIVTRGAVTDGVSRFISDVTFDSLNAILRPGTTGDDDNNTGGQGGSDPFAPPAQS